MTTVDDNLRNHFMLNSVLIWIIELEGYKCVSSASVILDFSTQMPVHWSLATVETNII